MYTNSKYTFHIFLTHLTTWKESRLLTLMTTQLWILRISTNTTIIHIHLDSHLSSLIGLVHQKKYQANPSVGNKGNNWANMTANHAAILSLMTCISPTSSTSQKTTYITLRNTGHYSLNTSNISLKCYILYTLFPFTPVDKTFLQDLAQTNNVCQQTNTTSTILFLYLSYSSNDIGLIYDSLRKCFKHINASYEGLRM